MLISMCDSKYRIMNTLKHYFLNKIEIIKDLDFKILFIEINL